MGKTDIDPASSTFGLPSCLHVPIAAYNIEAIEMYVGNILFATRRFRGRINAVCIKPYNYPVQKQPGVRLWQHPRTAFFEDQLHPPKQVWVHVDYSAYRKAYLGFKMPDIPVEYFLDHIQNREAIRIREYSHPYLRVCPVSRRVNTSGGSNYGGEGMEKQFLKDLPTLSKTVQANVRQALKCKIVYADPMDLTKMCDISPGTFVLPGVGESLKLFYPD